MVPDIKNSMRRWEILLPMQFNDGSPVPQEKVDAVIAFIHGRFGAASFETQTIRGLWQHEGKIYRDSPVRLFADVADTAENREWFVRLKERLKRDFQQLDVWITSHVIEVL
jgi:hypothetical protein